MVPGYDFWVWFTTRAMTNFICLKNLIRLYQVMYDSKRWMTFIVHWEEFDLPNMIFDMHPCGLHVYYPKKSEGQYGFVQNVAENHEDVDQVTDTGCVEGASPVQNTWVPIKCRLWGCSPSRWHWQLHHYSWLCQGSPPDLGSFCSST